MRLGLAAAADTLLGRVTSAAADTDVEARVAATAATHAVAPLTATASSDPLRGQRPATASSDAEACTRTT